MTGASPLAGALAGPADETVPTPSPDFELAQHALGDLRQALSEGRLTSLALTELYLSRIESHDQPFLLGL